MGFNDKYISTTDKKSNPESKKVVLTDDNFALCEELETLKNAIRGLVK